MEEKNLREFGESKSLCDEVATRAKRQVVISIITIAGWGVISILFLSSDPKSISSELKTVFSLFWFGMLLYCIYEFFRNMKVLGALSVNFRKNKLELKPSEICGICTEIPKVAGCEKHFRIPYEFIDRIEVKTPNLNTQEFYNFIIYHRDGWVRLAIQTPDLAKNTILEILERGGLPRDESKSAPGEGKKGELTYKCPRCGRSVVYGQAACENCGQSFDWTQA